MCTGMLPAAQGSSECAMGTGSIWDVEVSQNDGYLIGGPHNKDCSILGSILGSPYFGKLPCRV